MASEAELAAKIGVLLSNNTEVIQMLLRQLSALDLSRLQRVCRLWRVLVAKELANRHQLQFFNTLRRTLCEVEPGMKLEKKEFMRWKQHWQSKPSFCLHFHDVIFPKVFFPGVSESLKRHLPPTCQVVEVLGYGGLIGTRQIWPRGVETFRRILPTCQSTECPDAKPAGGGCWPPESQACRASAEATPPPHKRTRTTAASEGRLPEGDVPPAGFACRTRSARRDPEPGGAGEGCGVCRQVIRANVGATTTRLHPLVQDLTSIWCERLAVLCLPQLPGVVFLPLSGASASGGRADGGCDSSWGGCIPPSQHPKALLVFNDHLSDPLPHIREILEREEGRVAVAGGQLSDDRCSYRDIGTGGVYGVAVCGEGVAAASILLTEDLRTDEDVVRALSQLDQLYDRSKRSVALFFTCIGRPSGLEDSSSGWEANVFRRLYPTTPVFGCFVYGETCRSYVPYRRGSQEWEQQERRWRRALTTAELELYHAYSTAVLFLQFG